MRGLTTSAVEDLRFVYLSLTGLVFARPFEWYCDIRSVHIRTEVHGVHVLGTYEVWQVCESNVKLDGLSGKWLLDNHAPRTEPE